MTQGMGTFHLSETIAGEINQFVNEICHFLGFHAHLEGIQKGGMLPVLQIWNILFADRPGFLVISDKWKVPSGI